MDHHLVIGPIIVVEARLVLTQNKIGFKAHHVMKETAELINFGADNDIGT